METTHTFLKVFFFLASATAFAGRPVYQTHDLKNLAEASDEIWVAKKISEFSKPIAGTTCAESYWILEILKVVKGDKKIKKPSRVNVYAEHSGVRDCLIRQKNPSGASFRAEIYPNADHKSPQDPQGFLVFVKGSPKDYKFTVDQSYDNISKLFEVESLLGAAKTQ